MIVHVLPGDAQVEEFKRTGIEGEVAVCREALVDGDVRAASLDELWRVREDYLQRTYPEGPANYREGVVAEFEKLFDLPAAARVNLWFEYELFCHVNMWFCVWLLRDSRASLFRVAPIVQQKENRWSGFGRLTARDLTACYAERLPFSQRDIELGVDLWTAFQTRDYSRLRELSRIESACFPYLKEACEAEIERDSLPRKVLTDIRNEGVTDFGEMFAAFQKRAGVYGFGDMQVKKILNEI